MQFKTTLVNNNETWNPQKRYKINTVVSYLGFDYQNSTGTNSDPTLEIDWIPIKESVSVLPYATFKFLKKGFGNVGEPGESGDVYEGWVSAGIYCPHAVYSGTGLFDDSANFDLKTIIEY